MRHIRISWLLLVVFTVSCSAGQLLSEAPPSTLIIDKDMTTIPSSWTPQPTLPGTVPPSSPITSTPSPDLDGDTTTPEPSVPFYRLKMINTLDGWAWGSDGVWRTSNGGQSWFDVAPPDLWYFLYALDAQTAWATARHSQGEEAQEVLLRTSDGGVNWILITEISWRNVDQFLFYDQQNGLSYGCGAAAGTGICTIYETHDGGLSWTPLEFATDHHGDPIDWPGQYLFCNICGDAIKFDLDRLILVGGNMVQYASTTFPVWITQDRGQTWHYQEVSLPAGKFNPGLIDPYPPVFFGSLTGILPLKLANESYNQFGVAFYLTQDGGLTWSFQSLIENVSQVNSWSIMDFISSQDLFISCDADLCASHDGGQTWQRLSPNLSFSYAEGQRYVQQFDFADPLTGWALVEIDGNQPTLWKTLDGGQTWEQLSIDILP